IVGQDTDSESNLLSAGMPWILKLDKADFVGRYAALLVQEDGVRERLVGFSMPLGVVSAQGAPVVSRRRAAGGGSGPRASARVAETVGLAGFGPDLARDGAEIVIRVGDRDERALVTLEPFYDAAGERLRA